MRIRRSFSLVLAALLAGALLVAGPARGDGGTGDGTVLTFGGVPFKGSTHGASLVAPIVGVAATPDNGGYWLVAQDGGIFSFGNAPFHGSIGGARLARPIVGMVATSDGGGYWFVGADGGVFAFGNARFHGSAAGTPLQRPIVGMAATPDGGGYWLVAGDGGIFSFGNAKFHGSTGGLELKRPVVGMASTADGLGYWLVASDGGIFAFGTAPFHGSTGSLELRSPVTGMAPTSSGGGYWLVAGDGGVFSFGNAPFHGSGVGQVPNGRFVLGISTGRAGSGYVMAMGPRPAESGPFGPTMLDLQRRLNALGYWTPMDGKWSGLTQQAVYALQKSAGISRSGQYGAAERRLLEAGFRPTPRTGYGNLVEIDKRRQIIMIVRDGVAAYTFNTSTGNGATYYSGGTRKVAHTPEGRFRIYNAVNGQRVSELGELWRPRYFTGGYAVHGSPSIPPYPASHGCARVSNAAMNFIWDANLMPMGGPVWVYS